MFRNKENRKTVGAILLGSLILSFGLYNIHQPLQITDGGVIGGIILINHWTGINASYISFALDLLCYAFAFKFLGLDFIKKSVITSFFVAAFLRMWELQPPLITHLFTNQFIAAIAAGIFVGVGVGIIVRSGGSSGGDDALALIISERTGWKLAKAYMITDFSVLILSLSYIPMSRIVYSLITVTVSSVLIDMISTYRVQPIKTTIPQT
ncbi:YitT family protein [Erysipelothrix aquatica]|uniref:YitT family protein n=1 Tax=Erysipelothrix aquatica TaxID=2683714 RepID=UPI001357D087|nr:YitT family protein [Erysipelothrix aquatica]